MKEVPPTEAEQDHILPSWTPETRAEFFKGYSVVLNRVCKRFGVNTFDAEDVAQETMVRILSGQGRHDKTRNIWPWVKGIARNVIFEVRRKKSREIQLAAEPVAEKLFENIWQRELLEVMRQRVEGEQGKAASVARACLIDGLTTQEVTEMFDVPRAYVHNAVNRMRRKIIDLTENLED